MKKYNLPTASQKVETVILANGEFPSYSIPLSILNHCNYLVCCDGATNNLYKTSKSPDAIVGDCDSLSEDNRIRYSSIIHCISEQETNDLTKAVNFCRERDLKTITIVGATGKREDHTIANISLLCEYMNDCEAQIITDYGIFIAIDRPAVFESKIGQQVSIFSIDRCSITTNGLKYPIKNQTFNNWWQATLNESTETEFSIDTNGRTIIYRAF
ncbi:thiamine diphosphokinase [Dysgonomonas sp. Marseille-P4361]|uniref:thiamine diphosphokinase n=1 Tax=Dysgonomonas sp. Marseille-P4361 TaxID=2161820 RepID=UPI000D560E53|nr:thiamine diphosphokinase [Dysgonomonas sp. Marseille-P4361]